ncbi:MAG: peptidylprolyl isomerase [Bacteroidota bacterium]
MKKTVTLLSLIMFFMSAVSFGQKNIKSDKKATMEKVYYVQITTDLGTMKVKLYNETPLHRDNFVKLVSEGFYDSLLFHRVIKGFMIQGGDPQSKNAAAGQMLGSGDVGYRIPAEFNDSLYHKKGVLAAARDNNPEKASSGCQFYIVQGKPMIENELQAMERRSGKPMSETKRNDYKTIGGSAWLDGEYTVFGEVVEGLDVIDKIAAVPCGPMDRPASDVRMKMVLVDK